MPELVKHTVTTAELLRGDVTTYGEVVVVDRKIKWATVTFADGSTERVPVDEEWTIDRLERTADEKAAERLRFTLEWLDREQRGAVDALDAAREKTARSLLAGEEQTHWTLLDVIVAQERFKLWEEFRRGAAYQVNRPEDEQLTLLEVLRELRADVAERLLERTSFLSRSTSVVSNVVEDAQREVQARWLRDTRYGDR